MPVLFLCPFFALGSPFKGSCRRRRLRGPLRQMPPSVERPPQKSAPSQFQQPKGGGSLVSTHAALSPELGSSLKAQSGCKSGTTAPGVQGAGRGPRQPPSLPSPRGGGREGEMPAQESDPPVGAGPDNPSGGMPENPRRGNPSSRGSQPAGMPENSKRKNLFRYQPTGGRRETHS